jgi:lysozyme
MDLQAIAADLRRYEGCRLAAYWDPIGKCWTIGYGHTGPDVGPHTLWSLTQCENQLFHDIGAAAGALDTDPLTRPWWRGLDDARQEALVEMGFNLGEHTLDEFRLMLAAMAGGFFAAAADQALDSAWAEEVNGDGRASFIATMIRTGQRPVLVPRGAPDVGPTRWA